MVAARSAELRAGVSLPSKRSAEAFDLRRIPSVVRLLGPPDIVFGIEHRGILFVCANARKALSGPLALLEDFFDVGQVTHEASPWMA